MPEREGGRYFFTQTTGCRTRTCSTPSTASTASRACCSIPTRSRPTARSRCRPTRSARTASSWPTRSPTPAPTGTSGRCATWPPAATSPITSSGSSSRAPRGPRTARVLLQPLRRAEGRRGARGRQLLPEALLPRARHGAGRDVLVYERKDQKDWGFGGEVTEDGRYLVHLASGRAPIRRTAFFYKDLTRARPPAARWSSCSSDFDADYTFVGNDGPRLLVPHRPGRAARPDRRDRPAPARSATHWKELVPRDRGHARGREPGRATASSLDYLHDARSRVAVRRPGRQAARRGRAARPRHRGGLRRRARRHARPSTPSPASPRRRTIYRFDFDDRQERGLPPAEGGLRSRRLRDQAGLLHEQGRHPRADVHQPQEGAARGRHEARRCSTATAASTSRSRPASR